MFVVSAPALKLTPAIGFPFQTPVTPPIVSSALDLFELILIYVGDVFVVVDTSIVPVDPMRSLSVLSVANTKGLGLLIDD